MLNTIILNENLVDNKIKCRVRTYSYCLANDNNTSLEELIKIKQNRDEAVRELRDKAHDSRDFEEVNGVLIRKTNLGNKLVRQLVVPESLKNDVLKCVTMILPGHISAKRRLCIS